MSNQSTKRRHWLTKKCGQSLGHIDFEHRKSCRAAAPTQASGQNQPVNDWSATMRHTVYLVYLHFAASKFQIMLHPKIAGIRPQLLLSRDVRGLVHGMPHLPEMKWLLEKSMSQCEINCLVKVGFNWNDQSNLQMTNVQFARLRFIGSLGWQKS